jgi:hypothetical protein
MTTPTFLPSLAGLGWSVTKTPRWSTRSAKHVSGRETLAPLFAYPLYDFELTYDGLDSSSNSFPNLGAYSMQSLMGFFQSLSGRLSPFLYADPIDSYAANQLVATADGVTTNFVMSRPIAGYSEPVGWVTNISGVNVGGVNSPTSAWSLVTPNTLSFVTAPTSGQDINATFSYAFYCRMAADDLEFEQFMHNLHAVKSFKFSSARTS